PVGDRRLLEADAVAAGFRAAAARLLAGEQAAGERAPDQDADLLVEAERYQFVFGFARVQGVVDLLRDEALLVAGVGDPERLHQVPGGVVGAAHIAHLTLADQGVERFHRLLERRLPVPFVHLVEIDDVGFQALKALLAFADDVPAAETGVVGAVSGREADLGGEQQAVAAAVGQRLADNGLGHRSRVDVRGVDEVDAVIEAEVDLALRFTEVGVAPEAIAAEGGGADGEFRDLQPRAAEPAIAHGFSLQIRNSTVADRTGLGEAGIGESRHRFDGTPDLPGTPQAPR